MRKICRALVLCMLLLAAFDTTIAGLIAAVDKDHAVTMTDAETGTATSCPGSARKVTFRSTCRRP